MDKTLNQIIEQIDDCDDNRIEHFLDLIADIFTKKLNNESLPEQENCVWKLKYFDFGRNIRVSKMKDSCEVGYIIVDCKTHECVMSDSTDVDLLRIKASFEIAIFGDMV